MLAKAAFDMFILCLRMLQSTVAVLANLLTVICIIKYRSLLNPAGVLVASLAVGDILHGLVMYTLPLRTLASSLCIGSLTAEGITMLSQVMSFILIAMERRNSLLAQLNRSKKWSVRRAVLILTLVWVGIVVWSLAFTLSITNVPEGSVCNIMIFVTTFPTSFKVVHTVLFTAASLLLLTVYISIAQIVHKSNQQVASNQSPQQGQRRQADMRTTKMMALVVGIFCGLYIPMVISTATLTEATPMWQYVIHSLSLSISDINFWINPLIYAWRNKQFRKAFQNLFNSWRCCPRNGSNSSAEDTNTLSQRTNIQGPVMRTLTPRRDMIHVEPQTLQVNLETPCAGSSAASNYTDMSTLRLQCIFINRSISHINVEQQPQVNI